MISGKSSISIKKADLTNQKLTAIAYTPLMFAHKATAGETGINLLSLTAPSVEMPSLVQPTTAQLAAANLLFFNKNLILISSARGVLMNKLSYDVTSNTQINFVGFTSLAGEIFTGIISDAAKTGTRVVSTAIAPTTGTLAANTTDFPVGTPFRAGAFSSSQVGEVIVFLDGVQQYRNTGNSSTTLDANYYEYDPGSGTSNMIKFNAADPINARNVTVIYTNAVAERPDDSMMAVIESAQGQVNKLIEVVSDVSGLPESSFRVAPSNVDLATFGNRVLTLEQNRARVDVGNTWTANQQLPGLTTGAAIASGYIGEVIRAAGTGGTPVSGSYINVGSQNFGPGRWRIEGVTHLLVGGTQIAGLAVTAHAVSLSSSSIDTPSAGGFVQFYPSNPSASTDSYFYTTPRVFDFSTTTTVYLLARIDFTTLNGATFSSVNTYIQGTRIA